MNEIGGNFGLWLRAQMTNIAQPLQSCLGVWQSLQCLLEQAKEHGYLQLWEGKWKSAKHFPELESAYDIIVSFCLSACPEDFQSAQSSSSPGDSMNSGYNFERLEQFMNFHLYLDTERLQKLI